MKKALLIAYHFPPLQVSSGLQRTLAITQSLEAFGWLPLVLSASEQAYIHTNQDQLRDIPANVAVRRTWARDVARALSVGGRYPSFLALPDRWSSWWFSGVVSGLLFMRQHKPEVIWSTYPIATAHLIGLTLQRLTGLPWIADFRDSMTEDDYPRERARRAVFRWIERKTIQHCSRAVFTTPSAIEIYRRRYPEIPEERWVQIENGYNAQIFDEIESGMRAQESLCLDRPLKCVHSGVIYPNERDPRPFFDAIQRLKQNGSIDASKLNIVLRATGSDDLFRQMLIERDISDIVELAPSISYRDALREILESDILLLLQAANCNHQIPAKVYEYLRARKPILALTDARGDTAATLQEAGIDSIVALDDALAIIEFLPQFLEHVRLGTAPLATERSIASHSRQNAAEILAQNFDAIT